MEIIEYNSKYEEEFRNKIFDLGKYIGSLDLLKKNKILDSYRQIYVDNLFDKVKENNGKIYLCIDNDLVIGTIVGITQKKSEVKKTYHLGNTGEILELYIDQEYRRKNIGNELIKKMETYFKENDCDEIRLSVFASNCNAIDFYHRVGFSNRNIGMIKEI